MVLSKLQMQQQVLEVVAASSRVGGKLRIGKRKVKRVLHGSIVQVKRAIIFSGKCANLDGDI